MGAYYHSVVLEKDLCRGCTNCIKKCPTEAIRVQHGKAKIFAEKCIDCGECVKTCPYKAKVAQTDSWDRLADFKYTIAIPAPTLYLQFDCYKYTRQQILGALRNLGFDYVYEVARAAEIVTAASDKYLEEHKETRPIISSACPAVVRLIQVRFPSLIPNIMPIKSPMEVAAMHARKEFCEANNVNPKDVGVFFISPCAAKMTSVKSPIDLEKSNVSGVISIKSVYFKLLKMLAKDKELEIPIAAGHKGVRWSSSGGEAVALKTKNVLSVDGIQNVVHIFEELENDNLTDVDFIEANACTGGCIGGPLTVENVYVAKNRSRRNSEMYPLTVSPVSEDEFYDIAYEKTPEHIDITTLDSDMTVAMQKLQKMNEIYEQLPALDCGACGSPSCKALAEDIVRGKANIEDCIFVLRRRVKNLAQEMMELEGLIPQIMYDTENDIK